MALSLSETTRKTFSMPVDSHTTRSRLAPLGLLASSRAAPAITLGFRSRGAPLQARLIHCVQTLGPTRRELAVDGYRQHRKGSPRIGSFPAALSSYSSSPPPPFPLYIISGTNLHAHACMHTMTSPMHNRRQLLLRCAVGMRGPGYVSPHLKPEIENAETAVYTTAVS